MLNNISKMLLFCLAYLPLIFAIALKSYYSLYHAIGLVICSMTIIILVWQLIQSIKTIIPSEENISIVELKNSEFLTFIVTYLVPFFGFDLDIPTLVSSILIFFIIGYIYVDTSLFCVNPLLKLIYGYNLYEIIITSDKDYSNKAYLLSKSKLMHGKHGLKLNTLGENIYIEVN